MASQAIADEDDEMCYCSNTLILFNQMMVTLMRCGDFHPVSRFGVCITRQWAQTLCAHMMSFMVLPSACRDLRLITTRISRARGRGPMKSMLATRTNHYSITVQPCLPQIQRR